MMGSLLSRALIMILGYAYPAYECYKSIEMNKPDIKQLRFWCQYWILVALLTVFERIGDAFISWLPVYSEAKLACFIYLWNSKTKGTAYVYDTFFRPLVAEHEAEIDHKLLELRTRAGDVLVLYWQKAVSYGQTRFFEILQYVVSQSKSEPQSRRAHPVQQQQIDQTTNLPQQQPLEPTPPPSATAKNQLQEVSQPSNGASPAKSQALADHVPVDPKTAVADPIPVDPKTVADPILVDPKIGTNRSSEAQETQVDTVGGSAKHDGSNALPKETVMNEAIRRTRGKLRKRPAIGVPSRNH